MPPIGSLAGDMPLAYSLALGNETWAEKESKDQDFNIYGRNSRLSWALVLAGMVLVLIENLEGCEDFLSVA